MASATLPCETVQPLVRLLRRAGYGTPCETVQPLVRMLRRINKLAMC